MKKYASNSSFLTALLAILFMAACSTGGNEEEYAQGINLEYIDETVSPSEDFFRYVNGNWLNNTEIPSDQGRWGSFNELREYSREAVLQVLEQAAQDASYVEGSDERKAADFYAIGMDSLLAERVGVNPLQSWFEEIDAIEDESGLQKIVAKMHSYGANPFFGFFIFPDLVNSEIMNIYIDQGGMAMPDRDYYTKTDEKSEEIKTKYRELISSMFRKAGFTNEEGAANSDIVMSIEGKLAEAALPRVERRDPRRLYNKRSLEELNDLCASIDWNQYLTDVGVTGYEELIVTEPDFFTGVQEIISTHPVSDLKVYLKWHAINSAAPYLNHDLVKENFEFYGKTLRGTEEMRPRWKRVLDQTGGALGEAVGKLYVAETFPPEAKEAAREMVDNILEAMGDRIRSLEWMTDSTKEQALKKLSTFTVKIGYPDEWRDYSDLTVETGTESSSYFQNVMNSAKFQHDRQIAKLGKPVDKKEWGMTPQTVNAYYNPLNNEIVFPAAILQPPFYNYEADPAVNYGGIGAVIGHEISHGFDDQGSRFDSEGNMTNWWTDEDRSRFDERTGRLIAQYDAFEPLEDNNVNGRLTLGENIGDLGGLSVAYDGMMKHFEKNGSPGEIDGFTQEQRFFISWATIWRIKYRDEFLRNQLITDPHSPGMYRANGPISNMESFYEAFGVKEGDAMWRADSVRVKIW